MDAHEQNRIASENKKHRELVSKIDKLTIMVQVLSEEVAKLQSRKTTKKEEA